MPDFPVGAMSESIEAVEEWLSRLPAIHAWTCRLIYVYGMSHDEAADQLGYSRSYLFRLHTEALSELVRSSDVGEDRPSRSDSARSERMSGPDLPVIAHEIIVGPDRSGFSSGVMRPYQRRRSFPWAFESRNWRIEATTNRCCSSVSSG